MEQGTSEQLKIKWVMLSSVAFIVLNTIFIAKENYWFMLFPLALLVMFAAVVALDILMLAIVFLTPLSVILQQYDFGVAISIPTEPLLFGVMLIYILRLFYEGKVDRKIAFHPVTVAILINLLWITFTCITSSLPAVSWKFLLSRLWLVIPFYFVTLHLFREKKNMTRHLWLYMISFAGVIIYTIVNHAMENFSEEASHISMTPFYNDHTSYGAMLAMYLPPLVYFSFRKDTTPSLRTASVFMLILFTTGLILSFTRAAWLSLIVAAGVMALYLLRIRLIPILIAAAAGIGTLLYYQTDILISLESGRYKNTENRSFEQRVQSIANVTTDASNTERFNRWASAFRMFSQRPFFGWGPGTYQFQYAPFQISTEKTVISTNFGERGNSHSEYIGPMAESGLFGVLTVLGIVITTLLSAARIIYHTTNKQTRYFTMAVILGLVTYFVHGTLNNFLDTDKASAPFWGFIAMIVMLDLSDKEESRNKKEVSG